MSEFIANYWYVWATIFAASAGVIGYFRWKARQQKNFIVTGTALVGCLIAGFQALGAISAILTIIALIFKLIVWKVVG